MNLLVRPGQVFHPDSQDFLDRARRSITLRETVPWACHKSTQAFRQRSRVPQKQQHSVWSRHASGGPAGVQEQSFHTHNQSPTTQIQRRLQSRGGGQQRNSGSPAQGSGAGHQLYLPTFLVQLEGSCVGPMVHSTLRVLAVVVVPTPLQLSE